MVQDPDRSRHESGVVGDRQYLIPLTCKSALEHERLKPVVAAATWGLHYQAHPGNRRKCCRVAVVKTALRGQQSGQPLELGATERGVEIWKAVVETDFVVPVFPAV